jgi:hypothetical protein
MGLSEVLKSQELAKLGDTYINFVYSLAKSLSSGKGVNKRVPSKVLAESLKKAGLRRMLPSRTPIHDQADAVEALSMYAWFTKSLPIEEYVEILLQTKNRDVEAFAEAIKKIVMRLYGLG